MHAPTQQMSAAQSNHEEPSHAGRQGLGALTLAAIGVVYGDIGTSPLYTVKEIFSPATGIALNPQNLIGAVSCMLWALMLVVTLKYVILILRADNHGEGGGLALTALAAQAFASQPRWRHALLLLGVAGATLFYGDSVITPAISVLGAIEGLEVATPALKAFVVPITVAILIGLFALQRHGTAIVGRWFGPIILVWFVVLAATGIVQMMRQPQILAALDPRQAWAFLQSRGWHVFAAIGAIVLTITGAEALYADMGHFGRRPIQLAWNFIVLPSLALNYMGQGALLIADPAALENPFYRLFPDAWLIPALVLATLAAIIASQAVISGAYSLTQQAIQLGFLPRLTVRHTSARARGQIYMPAVNWLLLVGVVSAVLGFGSTSALAGAYGIAVTLTMLITTVMTYFVIVRLWRLPKPLATASTAFFLALDALLAAGCVVKFFDGGWFPLALGALLFIVMSTWFAGRAQTMASIRRDGVELEPFVASLEVPRSRVTRTAVYLVADPTMVPQALLHNLKHNQVLHERNAIATVYFHEQPWIGVSERVQVQSLGGGFWRVGLHFGFMNIPDVPQALRLCEAQGLPIPPFETSYFLSRETVVAQAGGALALWRERLFTAMSRNASGVAAYFRLPDNAVIELGTRVQI
jgi:KUP system potassium uptake protein